jgi:hypothetical protein
MNIILATSQFFIGNTFFTDQKRNIIMDGLFTKIIYSNEMLAMNGIYFLFPIEQITIETNQNNSFLHYSPYHPSNYLIIQQFMKIENGILEYYKEMNNYKHKTNTLLTKQLFSGNMKIYKEQYQIPDSEKKKLGMFHTTNSYSNNTTNTNTTNNNNTTNTKGQEYFVIKMSGVWETNNEIGITFKLYAMNS